MYRHACIAVMTLAVPPAAITLQDRRKASAVDKQQYLIPLLQVLSILTDSASEIPSLADRKPHR